MATTTATGGNANAKRAFTVIGIRALALLCLLGSFGALLAMWSDQGDIDLYIKDGVVSKARVLNGTVDESTIVWNNGDRGKTSYNFLHVVTDPSDGMAYGDFTKTGQESSLPEPPTGEPTDDLTRSLVVNDESLATIKQGDIVDVVTTKYDSSGGMLLAEITGRDYTTHYILAAIFAALAAGLWMLSRRFDRA